MVSDLVEFVVQTRRPKGGLPSCRAWQACSSETFEDEAAAQKEVEWWLAYDAFYMLTGWEYRIVQQKAKARQALTGEVGR